MDLFSKCQKFTTAREVMAAGYYPYFRRIETAQGPEVIIDGEKKIVCCSNNYLGLSLHPKVKRAAIEAIKKYGTSCTGSRFLSGSLDLHEKVERKFARFIGKESALLFTTGHHSNLGAISTLVGKNELVITDKLDHASIIDGCMLSFGEMLRYRHNNMEDLERVLSKNRDVPKLIVVDGVFSMEGDIANLPEIVKLAKIYNARVMVDDAHSLGVLGRNGRGTAEHFGLSAEVDIIMVTASKSLASIGGFIAGHEEVIHYIKHFARALIFTASLPPAQVAAIDVSLDIIEQEPELRQRLWKNTRKMLSGFKSLGFNTRDSETPIIPITVGDDMKAFQMCQMLFDEGVFASPVVSPAVPEGEALIRTSYMAIHTDKHLDRVLNAFEKVGKQLGVIPGAYRPDKFRKQRKIFRQLRIGTQRFRIELQKWFKDLFWRFGK
ncbi:MAG: 8-amino-7-oxononanoate synthase [Elusimicrobia bacterium CG1_02_37_114]|nr:MAG: 8-amino-7-oxononanoate synthase [Elusimicrobia bacterium CG1_02_37_114]PIV53377.1 MAG: 8-amino-7-oxononanoate synthase [Elusimicrobia bacterium CG02_land_8_20_14_3_00_37_13]PIZ13477.1 MAG: 8-amino-7-oxononanoate synthase [Elusimicrobia bacterium CG_4_10_14_0_8_um_filter_37_32]